MTSETLKIIAWRNARAVLGRDPTQVRQDAYGWYIVWSEYGNRNSDYGWEIDHVVPTALGGLNSAANVRALHWKNNSRLGGLLSGALG